MARKNRAKSDVLPKTRRGSIPKAPSSDVQSPRSPLFGNFSPISPTMSYAIREETSRTPEEWIKFAQKKLWESDKPASAVWFLATQGPDLLEYLMTGAINPS
jgi:hypothetical protein